MQIHVITAVHHGVPGRRMSAHLTRADADAEAMSLVATIAQDVEGAPTTPEDASTWPDHLKRVQRAIIPDDDGDPDEDDEDDLAALSGCYVTMTTLDVATPRVVVSIEGGLVSGIVADVEIAAHVVDYDTDGADDDGLIDIPQDDGSTAEGAMRGEDAEVDPSWIDLALAARKAHDETDG